jgi:hypothetical protein
VTRFALASFSAAIGAAIAVGSAAAAMPVLHVGRATRCVEFGNPKYLTPPSYLVSDLGRRGVPPVGTKGRAIVAKIRHYVHSSSLRFAYFSHSFIVFDAVGGPGTDDAPGYFVLNGKWNEYDEPGENPYMTIATPECLEPPRPWVPGDHGQGRNTSPNGAPVPGH